MRFRWLDNVGGYIRSPEPGCSFRPTGNFVGPYRFQHLEVDASTVMTNKSLTGPNRGYACGHLYFESEGMLDRLADELGMDPAEVRRRNLIPPQAMPYRTPSGGLYDSGDYEACLDQTLELARYDERLAWRDTARAEGKLVGIGLACVVEPSISNMGYITLAQTAEDRLQQLPKSGNAEGATVAINPLGGITVQLSTTPQGQGHGTVAAQVAADVLGVPAGEIDFSADTAPSVIIALDGGAPLVALAGIHVGCYELVGTDRVRRAA